MINPDPTFPSDEDPPRKTFKRDTTAEQLGAAGITLDAGTTSRLKELHGDVRKARNTESEYVELLRGAKELRKGSELLLDTFLGRLAAGPVEQDSSMPLFSGDTETPPGKKKQGPDRWHNRPRGSKRGAKK